MGYGYSYNTFLALLKLCFACVQHVCCDVVVYIYIPVYNNIYMFINIIYISLFILQRDGTEMMSRDCCCEAQKSSGALRADLVHQFQAQQRLP